MIDGAVVPVVVSDEVSVDDEAPVGSVVNVVLSTVVGCSVVVVTVTAHDSPDHPLSHWQI